INVLHRDGTAEQRVDAPRGHYFGKQGVPQNGVLCVADRRRIEDLRRSPPSGPQGRATGCTSPAACSIPGTPRRPSPAGPLMTYLWTGMASKQASVAGDVLPVRQCLHVDRDSALPGPGVQTSLES
ncbi:unnamed protein product, partial [Ixodes pacificus]